MAAQKNDGTAKAWWVNLGQRVLTAAVIVPLLLWLLYGAPKWGFLLLALFAAALASLELSQMTLGGSKLLRAWGLVATVGWMALVVFGGEGPMLLAGSIGLVAGAQLAVLVAPHPLERASAKMAWSAAGPLYLGTLLGCIALLHAQQWGGSWVVLSMMLAWFGDTGGYFAGRFFGQHKLYPAVSPKKTIEGSLGAIGGSLLGVLLAHFWYLRDLPLLEGLALGIVASVVGQAGDLVESLIKRSTGIKDSGNILPGHGGLLDRIDALLYTGATTWVYVAWIWSG